MSATIEMIRRELQAQSDAKTKESEQRFFKEEVKMYGLKAALVGKIAKDSFKTIKHKPKAEIFDLAEELWQSGYLEESFIACNWAYSLHQNFEPRDFQVFEKWVNNYVSNWASCDSFCNHTIGTFITMYPEYLNALKKWTGSPNRWTRRAAAVSLIIPAQAGKFLDDIFEIAEALLLDKDDLVQKGYGWLLKVAAQAHLNEVFGYVMAKKAVMPRTALRYAIEKMPKELKARAMEK